VLFLLVANLGGRDVAVVVVTATGVLLPLVLAPLGTCSILIIIVQQIHYNFPDILKHAPVV
jgi:hypothetical protein